MHEAKEVFNRGFLELNRHCLFLRYIQLSGLFSMPLENIKKPFPYDHLKPTPTSGSCHPRNSWCNSIKSLEISDSLSNFVPFNMAILSWGSCNSSSLLCPFPCPQADNCTVLVQPQREAAVYQEPRCQSEGERGQKGKCHIPHSPC